MVRKCIMSVPKENQSPAYKQGKVMMDLHNYCFQNKNGESVFYGRVYKPLTVGNFRIRPKSKNVYIKTIKAIGEDHVITTSSGTQYKLINPNGNKEEIIQEIKRRIMKRLLD